MSWLRSEVGPCLGRNSEMHRPHICIRTPSDRNMHGIHYSSFFVILMDFFCFLRIFVWKMNNGRKNIMLRSKGWELQI